VRQTREDTSPGELGLMQHDRHKRARLPMQVPRQVPGHVPGQDRLRERFVSLGGFVTN
jgi:hypothetical protein